MKEKKYNVVLYSKGYTGRKGKIFKKVECANLSEAITKLQGLAFVHDVIFYYSIERVEENE